MVLYILHRNGVRRAHRVPLSQRRAHCLRRFNFDAVSPPHHSSQATDGPSSQTSRFPDLNLEHPLPILIRATNGKSKDHKAEKLKLSTIIQPTELEAFYIRYTEVCKAGMSGLKKRDRSGRKAKEKKRKKKEKQEDKKG